MISSRAITLLLAAACAALTRPARAAAPLWVNRTEAEFATLLDADGDGDLDLVLADRATGFLRVGRRTGATSVEWDMPLPGGIVPLDSLAAGFVMTNARHSVALAGTFANRVALVDLLDAVTSRTPKPLFPQRAGPCLAAALDTLAGNSTEELFLTSDLNGGTAAFHRQLFSVTGYGQMTSSDDSAGTAPFSFVAGIAVSNNALPRVAGLLPAESRIWLFGAGVQGATLGPAPYRTVTLTEQTQFVYGFFAPAATFGQFLLYTPGSTTAHRIPLQADHTYGVAFGSATTFTLPTTPAHIAPGPGANELTILRTNGRASVYTYDGTALTLVNSLALPAGVDGAFAGALTDPVTRHAFLLVDTDGDGRSDTSCRYSNTGGTYAPAEPAVSLPALADLENRPNTLAFVGEPLVNAAAARVAAYSVSDWSVSQSGVTPNTSVSAAADRGPALGLGSPSVTVVSGVPSDATHILVDQVATDIGVQPLFAAAGESISELLISPNGGAFDNALQVTVTAPASANRILYRLDPADLWTEYAGISLALWLFKDTTLQCYGWNNGTKRTTPIASASFVFTRPPEAQDSDGDGVPDFVEFAYGLDPSGGQDSDGDGLSDLNEILGGTNPDNEDSDGDGATDRQERAAGTDPNSAASVPANTETLDGNSLEAQERLAVYDLYLSPRPYDGFIPAYTVCDTNVSCRVTALDGSLLGTAVTANHDYPFVPNPSLKIEGLPSPFEGLLAGFTTPAHFDVYTLSSDKTIGRELVKLIVAPPATPVVVNYTWSNSVVAAEVAAWSNAAQSAYAAATRPSRGESANVMDTLTAALFEAFAARELLARGLVVTSAVSLFPARTEPDAMPHPTAAQLLALQTATVGECPAYGITNTLAWLRTACTNETYVDVVALRALALEIYRTASIEMNDAPGQYPLPFDAIREIIRQGTVSGSYTNHISSATASTAKLGADRLLGLIPERIRVTRNLLAGAPPTPDTAILADPSDGLRYSLVKADGNAFPLAFAVAVPSNSTIRVTGFLNGPDARRGANFEIEVISLTVTALPAPSPTDHDGNLLPDAYELLVFGEADTPFGRDLDADGYADLQEYLENTDPSDAASTPGVAPATLGAPEIVIELADAHVAVSWLWPARYQSRFAFTLESTDNLQLTPFAVHSAAAAESAGDSIFCELPLVPEGSRRFYRVRVALR